MTLTVHHLKPSRGHRVLWLLEELGLDYELVLHRRKANLKAGDSLFAVHPLGKSPVLVHDGRAVVESAVIAEYVLDRFGDGRLRPAPGTPEFERYRFYLHFAEGSMMPPLLLQLVMGKIRAAVPLVGRLIAGQVVPLFEGDTRAQLGFVERELADRDFLAGDVSAADILMHYPLAAAFQRVADRADHPALAAWLDRVESRPAFRVALDKTGDRSVLG